MTTGNVRPWGKMAKLNQSLSTKDESDVGLDTCKRPVSNSELFSGDFLPVPLQSPVEQQLPDGFLPTTALSAVVFAKRFALT